MTIANIEGADIGAPTPCKTCAKSPTTNRRADGKFQVQCCTKTYGWGETVKVAIWVWNKINLHTKAEA